MKNMMLEFGNIIFYRNIMMFFMLSGHVSMLLTTCELNIFPSYDGRGVFYLIFFKFLF